MFRFRILCENSKLKITFSFNSSAPVLAAVYSPFSSLHLYLILLQHCDRNFYPSFHPLRIFASTLLLSSHFIQPKGRRGSYLDSLIAWVLLAVACQEESAG